MKTWIRWTLGGTATLVVAAAAAVAIGYRVAEAKLHRTVSVAVQPVAVPADAAALERGRHLFASRGCMDCHGANGAGRRFIDEGPLRAKAPHIGNGPGSVTARYRTEDWVRSIRHGVNPDGRPLLFMPSEDYNRLSDTDLGALIAHLKQLPASEGSAADIQTGPLVRLLYAAGIVRDAADKIDHRLPPQPPVDDGVTVAHGRYVANMCIGCHGVGLAGGRIPGSPPDWPAAANLTPGVGSVLPRYADADTFARMLKSGKRPDGSAIAVMPFESLSQLNDTEVKALHAYLQTLPARAAGSH